MKPAACAVLLAALIAAASCKTSGHGIRPGILLPIQQQSRDPDPTRPPEAVIWSGPEYQEQRAEMVGAEQRPPELEQLERLLAVLAATLAGGYLPLIELFVTW